MLELDSIYMSTKHSYYCVMEDVNISSCFFRFLAVEMASTAGATGWLRGRVKAVPSGDSLVIMGSTKAEIPPEKTITLSSLIAPRLVNLYDVHYMFHVCLYLSFINIVSVYSSLCPIYILGS